MVPFSIFKYAGCLYRGRLFPPPIISVTSRAKTNPYQMRDLFWPTLRLSGAPMREVVLRIQSWPIAHTLGEMSMSNNVWPAGGAVEKVGAFPATSSLKMLVVLRCSMF